MRKLSAFVVMVLLAAVLPGTGDSTTVAQAPRSAGSTTFNLQPSTFNSQETVRRNVTYCTAGDVALKMDIYFPKSDSRARAPAVLYVHGGSWVSGDKFEVGLGGVELANNGYLVA